MSRFLFVLIIVVLSVTCLTLMWPRFFETPRPQALDRLNTILRGTTVGQQAANVLGVSDEQSINRLSPQVVLSESVQASRNYVTDVIITHASRLIIDRFSSLPEAQQQKILEAMSHALSKPSVSPSQDLPEATQSSTNTNN